MKLNILDFITKPDVSEKVRQGLLSETDLVVKECVTDIQAYHYFYDQPVPPTPVGPASNEIWYATRDGQPYPLETYIENLKQMGLLCTGPEIVSNIWDEDKQMYVMTFDSDVLKLGFLEGEDVIEGPFFINMEEIGVSCNINSIILPNNIERIGQMSFYQCYDLSFITIPDSVINIGFYAFSGCMGLTSAVIPDNVKHIGEGAFNNCTSLSSVFIGNGVDSIENNTFSECISLSSIIIPNNIINIKNAAFNNCTSLTSIEIPNSVTNIGDRVFDSCGELTSAILGSGITSIGFGVFHHCEKLESVICLPENPPQLNDTSNNFVSNSCQIYVPADSVNIYKSAQNWSTYADQIQAIQ